MRLPQKYSCSSLTCKTWSFASVSSLFLSSFSICGYNTLRSAWATACARCAFHFSTKRLNSSWGGGEEERRGGGEEGRRGGGKEERRGEGRGGEEERMGRKKGRREVGEKGEN